MTEILSQLGLLEDFSIKPNIPDGECLLTILDLLKKLASSLKTINVDIGSYGPTEDDHADLVDFLVA